MRILLFQNVLGANNLGLQDFDVLPEFVDRIYAQIFWFSGLIARFEIVWWLDTSEGLDEP